MKRDKIKRIKTAQSHVNIALREFAEKGGLTPVYYPTNLQGLTSMSEARALELVRELNTLLAVQFDMQVNPIDTPEYNEMKKNFEKGYNDVIAELHAILMHGGGTLPVKGFVDSLDIEVFLLCNRVADFIGICSLISRVTDVQLTGIKNDFDLLTEWSGSIVFGVGQMAKDNFSLRFHIAERTVGAPDEYRYMDTKELMKYCQRLRVQIKRMKKKLKDLGHIPENM